jgi:hypothetical protein
MQHRPIKPAALNPIAAAIIEELRKSPEAKRFVLGGYFALSHYLDYRQTHDIGAWWDQAGGKTESGVQAAREAMNAVARKRGFLLRERERGDVFYFTLHDPADDRAVFSFQIAERSKQLAEPLASPYPPIMIEAIEDNVAAKMTALVSRGAPRDFMDIYSIVQRGLCGASEAWHLWRQKNPNDSMSEAKAEILRSLEAIEARRPLASIPRNEANQAQKLRGWFRREFAANAQDK